MNIEVDRSQDSVQPEASEEMITETSIIEENKCLSNDSKSVGNYADTFEKNEPCFSKTAGSADQIRNMMLDHLANKSDIHFKSQQLGEPDLSFSEKRAIAENVLNQSHSTFLSRFGSNLLMEHLTFFANPKDEESYEVQYYVNKLKSCKCKLISQVQIKNRRFEAMKRLMSEGEYFSVSEMRKRNPLLFEQLLGNFLGDPESKVSQDQEHAVAHILLEQIEQDQVAALRKQQMEMELEESKGYQDSSDEENITTESYESTTWKEIKDNLAPWGTSYKSNPTIGKARWKKKQLKPRNLADKNNLSHEEKLLLINEFTSSMFNSFLHGKDEFDYSEVDNNPEYDDVNQCDVDEEEKYFNSESPEEKKIVEQGNEEDELDKFMKSIDTEVTSENMTSSFQRMNAEDDKDIK